MTPRISNCLPDQPAGPNLHTAAAKGFLDDKTNFAHFLKKANFLRIIVELITSKTKLEFVKQKIIFAAVCSNSLEEDDFQFTD